MKKEEILKNLLNKTFNKSLLYLENRTSEQLNSLQMTDKQFIDFNKQIFNLKLNYEQNKLKESKIISNTFKTISSSSSKNRNYSTPKKMIRNRTSHSTFQSGSSTRSNTNNIKKNQPKITQPFNLNNTFIKNKNNNKNKKPEKNISKKNTINNSFTYEQNKNNLSIRAKSLITQRNTILNSSNKKNISNTNPNNNNKDINNKINYKSKLNKSMMTIRPQKSHEIQAEILDIQQQIKKVENVVGNAEKSNIIKRTKTSPGKLKKKIIDLSIYFDNIDNSNIIINNIIKFTNKNDSIKLISLNKKNCKKSRIKFFEDKIKDIINKDIDDEIDEIEKEYDEALKIEIPKFQISKGSIKAIGLLNQDLYVKIFFDNFLPQNFEHIIIIYRILAQLIKNENLINIKNNKDFWREFCYWFILEGKNKLGFFINQLIKQFDFSKENVKLIKRIVNNTYYKIIPSIYSNLCITTGLIVFIIKDALEYCGIIINKKKTPIKVIYEELKKEKENIKILEEMEKNVKNM